MDGDKRILVFSDAGGTGRSYHADLGARNQARRVHFLLEPGWRADAAIQGLGPDQPHQPGLGAAVPAGDHRRARRAPVHLDDRAPARQPGRAHPRPAPDRRAEPVRSRRQSRKRLRQGGAQPLVRPAVRRQARGGDPRPLPGADRPDDRGARWRHGRGPAADPALAQPHPGAAASRCRTRSSTSSSGWSKPASMPRGRRARSISASRRSRSSTSTSSRTLLLRTDPHVGRHHAPARSGDRAGAQADAAVSPRAAPRAHRR